MVLVSGWTAAQTRIVYESGVTNMHISQYADDHAAIDADMEFAVSLDFPQFVAYLADYGARLHALARVHVVPEGAFLHLREHADRALARLQAG
jgi:hypothetical protein